MTAEVVRITIIYYAEVNLICIFMLALFAWQRRFRSDRASTDNRVFSLMLWVSVLLCAADMVAGICRGRFFPGARTLIVVSNMLYYEAISAVCYLWLLYVLILLKIMKRHIRGSLLCASLFIGISIVTLINPWTDFLFSVDANNCYVRGDGVWLHWLISWSYLLITTGITLGVLLKKKNRYKWRKFRSLLFFIIPIKVKYLAYLDAALFVFGVITMSFPLNLLPVVAVLNYLVYCGDWLFDFFRPSHVRQRQKTVNFKREARRIRREQANEPYHYKCAVCGRTDTDHPELEFRYCSRCVGYHCFCQDHINNHIHFTE